MPIIGNKNEEAIDIRSANRRILFFFALCSYMMLTQGDSLTITLSIITDIRLLSYPLLL